MRWFEHAMPAISIIVPVHNTELCLPDCLESILAQTEPDIEVLCVDDGSTDQSLAVLRRYASADPRVKILCHEGNFGVSAARNTGMEAATGEYIAFVDSDDALTPDFCRKLHEAARRTGADIAKGNYAYRHHDRIDFGINRKIREDKANFYIQCCSAIYRAELLQKHGLEFSPGLDASEDLVFAFRAANRANAVAIVDDAHIVINTRPGSATFAAPEYRTLISHYRAFAMILQTALSSDMSKAGFNHVLGSLFALFIRIAARNRNPKIRRFVVAKNTQLFKAARTSRQWDPALFAAALKEDISLLACLEENSLPRFFARIDAMQAQRCRLLRSRSHDPIRPV
jgi:glycosyltransferase involved in cell wall biosynthesis